MKNYDFNFLLFVLISENFKLMGWTPESRLLSWHVDGSMLLSLQPFHLYRFCLRLFHVLLCRHVLEKVEIKLSISFGKLVLDQRLISPNSLSRYISPCCKRGKILLGRNQDSLFLLPQSIRYNDKNY